MRRLFVTLAVLLGVAASASAAEWVRVETPNFVVYGEEGERATREVAIELERVREVLARVLPAAQARSAVPMIAVAFNSRASFAPYSPTFEGRTVDVGGYFRGSDHEGVIAFANESRGFALRTIFHEYTHLAISNNLPGVPSWFGEGLADYFSTFVLQEDGRQALLGGAVRPHLRLLSLRPLLPLRDLLAVTHESPIYNAGEARSIFYAQSWALVHYLLSESPEGAADLARYATRTSAGVDATTAWREVFGTFDPMPALAKYVRQVQLKSFVHTFPSAIEAVEATVTKVPGGEADAMLGNLLTLGGTSLAAEARFQKVIASGSSPMRARALLGLTHAAADDVAAALDPLVAAASDADWLTAYYAAVGLERVVATAGGERQRAAAEAAGHALATVLASRPELAHALAMRARVTFLAGGEVTAALRDVRQARALAPGRRDYAVNEAQMIASTGDFAAAREILAPLLSPSAPRDTRELAAKTQALILELEDRAAERKRRVEARERAVQPLGEATIPRTAPEPAAVPATPVFRSLRSGEQRTEGFLERVECEPGGAAILHVRADGYLLRFTAASLERLEFISHREGAGGPLACGVRSEPDPVYVSWRPLRPARRAVAGRAVAVEVLPAK